jgi:hypothetical protein
MSQGTTPHSLIFKSNHYHSNIWTTKKTVYKTTRLQQENNVQAHTIVVIVQLVKAKPLVVILENNSSNYKQCLRGRTN